MGRLSEAEKVARDKGYEAFERGYGKRDNPYDPDTDYNRFFQWDAGLHEAIEDSLDDWENQDE